MEIADNLDVRATPAVNTLVVITHHRHVLVFVDEQLQEFVLNVIRVLVFIDHHITEALRQLRCQIGNLLQHVDRVEQQVIKVHSV